MCTYTNSTKCVCTMEKKMACWKLLLSFIISFFFFISSVSSQKVNVSVYYESLCPQCANFIIRNLYDAFENELIDIINLRMVPWGNSYISRANSTIVCQHGRDECALNTIQACSINVWNDANKYYGLIYCIELLVVEGKHQKWQTCFNELGLSKIPILDCYNSANGTKLSNLSGYETAHLSPPHTLLPWVVVNNQPLRNDYANFTAYICNAYKGIAVPKACNNSVNGGKSNSSIQFAIVKA